MEYKYYFLSIGNLYQFMNGAFLEANHALSSFPRRSVGTRETREYTTPPLRAPLQRRGIINN